MQRPDHLVSLSPNISMILFALGADDLVVGRTEGCLQAVQQYAEVWHRSESDAMSPRLAYWRALPVVGSWPMADAEAVRACQPDLVLTSGSGFGMHDAATFGLAADAVYHFDTRTLHDLELHIQQIGARLGRVSEAEALVAQIEHKCQDARARQAERATAPTVLFEYCVCSRYDPDPARRLAEPSQRILVGGHLAPDMIRLSGGEPICVQPGDTARWVEMDEIRAAQPEMILYYDCHGCPTAKQHPVETRPGWSELPAVTKRAAYPLHETISDPNLCFPAGLEELLRVMHNA